MNVSQSDILIDLFNDQETNNRMLRKVNGIPRRHCATIDAFCLKSQGTNGSTAVCKRTRIYSHTKLWHPILQNKPKTEHYPWQSSSQIIQNFVWLPADFLRIAVAFLKNWTSWTKKTSQGIAMVLFWLRRVSETCCKWQETWWKKISHGKGHSPCEHALVLANNWRKDRGRRMPKNEQRKRKVCCF